MKPFSKTASFILALIAFGHVIRAVTGFDLIIGDISIPMWASWLTAVIAGTLSYMVCRESQRD